MILQRLYIESPRWLKKLAGMCFYLVPRQYLYGSAFRQLRKFLHISQYWSDQEIKAYQRQKLKEILSYAYDNCPYYQKILNQARINPREFDSLQMMQQIPYLDKETIRANFDQLQSQLFPKSRRGYVTTGGTSGQPFGFYIDKARSVIEWAFLTKMWERVGFSIGDRRLVLRGEVIKRKRNGHWDYDPLLNQLSISTFHMDDENLDHYLSVINEFKPQFIHGYPSAITILAQYIKRNKVKLKCKPKAAIAISENVFEHQRKFIEEVLDCRFFSFYGHSEKLILAGECEHSSYYHIQPEYGYAEIINKDGHPVEHEGEVGELVGTGFINHAMPFIRYRTGDIVIYSREKCRCGRNYLLLKDIQGRWIQEMIKTKTGGLISITALNMHSSIYDRVAQFQFEQDKPGEVIFKIVKADGYRETDTENIKKELNTKFDNQVALIIKFVDHIEPTIVGKRMFLVQRLKLEQDFFNH